MAQTNEEFHRESSLPAEEMQSLAIGTDRPPDETTQSTKGKPKVAYIHDQYAHFFKFQVHNGSRVLAF